MRSRLCTGLFALALSASADQGRMDVNAEILGKCTIDSVRPIDFGDLEQTASSPDRIALGGVHFWCSLGLRYKVSANEGLNPNKGSRRMKGQAATNANEYLTYELIPRRSESGTGLGPAYPEFFEMEATVKGENYDPISVGPYLDTVVVTIST
jgi:spore coat protein U-like protein